ncbi:MAG: hypothetical protein ACRDWY_08395 [Actinomycetes bacterium]
MEHSVWPDDPDWSSAEDSAELQRHIQKQRRLEHEAMQEVGSARGRPVSEVQEDFQRALQARGVTMPQEQLAWWSRVMADPLWSLKHPILAARERRTVRRQDKHSHKPPTLIREAMDEIAASARGQPVEEVQEDFRRALAARGLVLPREVLASLSRAMADPRWSLKHPILAARDRRSWGWQDADDDDDPDDDPVLDRLSDLLLVRQREVTVVSGRWTPRGARYFVGIFPWSDEAAERIRRVCAPTSVTVVERRTPMG